VRRNVERRAAAQDLQGHHGAAARRDDPRSIPAHVALAQALELSGTAAAELDAVLGRLVELGWKPGS